MDTSMQVSFRESGGVVGALRGVDLDTAHLEDAEARTLEHLVEESGLSGRSESFSDRSRDLRQYEVVIRRDDVVASLVCDDRHVPRRARPLLRYLIERSAPLPPDGTRRS